MSCNWLSILGSLLKIEGVIELIRNTSLTTYTIEAWLLLTTSHLQVA